MLDKLTNEELQKFFESKTGLPMAMLTRYAGHATIVLDKNDGKNFVTFQVTDAECRAIPKERIGRMEKIWLEFLASKKENITSL